eukprot:763474-Hanusia_phi.AAC.5
MDYYLHPSDFLQHAPAVNCRGRAAAPLKRRTRTEEPARLCTGDRSRLNLHPSWTPNPPARQHLLPRR